MQTIRSKNREAPSTRTRVMDPVGRSSAQTRSPPTEFQMTPEEHRRAEATLRTEAAQSGAPEKEWAERIARNHEIVADAIAHRRKRKLRE